MSKRRPREDAMILMAVKLYNASTVSTVRQSLLGAEFTPKESDDRARQMKVRRRVIKRNDASNGSTATRAPSAIDAVSPASAVSSITAPSPAPKFPPPPKLTQIQGTTKGYNAQNKQQSTCTVGQVKHLLLLQPPGPRSDTSISDGWYRSNNQKGVRNGQITILPAPLRK